MDVEFGVSCGLVVFCFVIMLNFRGVLFGGSPILGFGGCLDLVFGWCCCLRVFLCGVTCVSGLVACPCLCVWVDFAYRFIVWFGMLGWWFLGFWWFLVWAFWFDVLFGIGFASCTLFSLIALVVGLGFCVCGFSGLLIEGVMWLFIVCCLWFVLVWFFIGFG